MYCQKFSYDFFNLIFQLGLIHYWRIAQGNLLDTVKGRDMTIQSNGYFTNDRNGNPNSALLLSHGFASIPPGVYFDPATGGFTFMAWIQVFSYNNWQRIFDFGNGQNNDNILIAFPSTGDNIRLDTYNKAGRNSAQATDSISLNTWYHIAVSVSSGVSSFYINAVQRGGTSGKFLNFFQTIVLRKIF